MNRILKTTLAIALGAATLASTADMSFARSKNQYCRNVARHEANRSVNNSVGTGLASGLLLGGAYGALTGGGRGSNIVTGLAVGGAGGALLGAASSNSRRDRIYRQVYEDCMYN
jgi:uncharacterized protein YcfJ